METVKNTDNFLKGALLLTFGGIISKVLGAIYRIPLTNLLGTYAMGLYQLVFPLYGLLITAGIGFSIAVSRAVARERQLNQCVQCGKILRCALFLLGGIGLLLSISLYFFADDIARIQGNALIANAYKILSPSVFFVCCSGALRGYFQGQMNMTPSVVSQVAEQIAKLVLGLIFARNALPDEIGAVNGAIFAVTLSEILSLGVFALYYLSEKKKVKFFPPLYDMPTKEIILQLTKTALPVTLGGILAPLSQLVDSSLTLKLLQTDATRMYGIWSGPVHSLFAMPLMLSVGIFSAILPNVSGNLAVGNLKEVNNKINFALKFNTVIVLPCVIGFIFFSPQIITLLYGALPQEDIALSAKLLSVAGIGALFACYAGTFSSVLQGAGKEYFSLLFTAVGMAIKTIVNVIFLPNDKVGVFAIAFSTILCYFVSVALSAVYLRRKIGIKLDIWNIFAKPLFAGVSLAIPLLMTNLLAYDFVSTSIGTILSICFSGLIYVIMVLTLKIFDGLLPTLKNKFYRGKKYAKPINSD